MALTPALPLVWDVAEQNSVVELLQAFSTPWFLFSNATNHHLVFFLLEIFSNIIKYQFDAEALVHAVVKACMVRNYNGNKKNRQSITACSLLCLSLLRISYLTKLGPKM